MKLKRQKKNRERGKNRSKRNRLFPILSPGGAAPEASRIGKRVSFLAPPAKVIQSEEEEGKKRKGGKSEARWLVASARLRRQTQWSRLLGVNPSHSNQPFYKIAFILIFRFEFGPTKNRLACDGVVHSVVAGVQVQWRSLCWRWCPSKTSDLVFWRLFDQERSDLLLVVPLTIRKKVPKTAQRQISSSRKVLFWLVEERLRSCQLETSRNGIENQVKTLDIGFTWQKNVTLCSPQVESPHRMMKSYAQAWCNPHYQTSWCCRKSGLNQLLNTIKGRHQVVWLQVSDCLLSLSFDLKL